MKILFYNRDTGAAIESTGEFFIDLLSRVEEITEIDVIRTQDMNIFCRVDFSKYDLIFLNDITHSPKVIDLFTGIKTPVVNIVFGMGGTDIGPIDLYLDYNVQYTTLIVGKCCITDKIKNIKIITGNLWENYKPWEERSDDILYISRFNKQKIIPGFIDYIRKQNKKIKFYGLINDQDYYEENKDDIDYRGYVNRKDLIEIYNNHKYIFLFSITECLSFTIREALLCGTYPIVLDTVGYTTDLEGYILAYNKDSLIPKKVEDIYSKINYKLHNHHTVKNYLKELFSFDKTIITFLTELEILLKKDLTFNNNVKNETKINYLGPERLKREDGFDNIYTNDVIDWSKVKI